MVATIAFYFLTVKAKIEALSLPPHMEQTVYNVLIPGIYLRLASSKAPNAAARQNLRTKSEEILNTVLGSDGPLHCLEKEDQLLVWRVAQECANVFQRSSYSVEGRNGQLSLRHHGLHRIRARKLAALTAVHNFFIKRSDHTTAAERFFRAKHRDLFQYLLDRVDLPRKPAQKKRPEQISPQYPVLSGIT
jgi:endo-beta-N-acetylglucosaminidase D